MSGELTPEDREYLREHERIVDAYLAAVLGAAGQVGPISFESLSMSAGADPRELAAAARLAKRIVDAAQPKAFE